MRIDNLKFGFDNIIEIEHLTLPRIGHVVVSGANGIGKSTFVKCLINYATYEGDIFYEDKNIKDIDLMQNFFYVPQYLDKYFILPTVIEEMKFCGCDIDNLNEFGLIDMLNHNPNRLSGGEKIRLIFAMIKSTEKKVIILDETLNSNDKDNLKNMRKEIAELSKAHLVIEIAHHIDEFDLLLHLENNKIILFSSKEEYDTYRKY